MKKTGRGLAQRRKDAKANGTDQERNGLLAKVHIAKKELGLDDTVYRVILRNEFGVDSSGKLKNRELECLIQYFQNKGWQPKRGDDAQIEALKERVGQVVLHSDLTPARVRGLTRKICGVQDVSWCRDVEALKRLLAALGKIIKQEADSQARAGERNLQ